MAVSGAKGGQAGALRVFGTKAAFHDCTVDDGQDMLYDQKCLHYFKSWVIIRSLYKDLVSVTKQVEVLMA
jgi:pectinesterase